MIRPLLCVSFCNPVGFAEPIRTPITPPTATDTAFVPRNDRAYNCIETLQKVGIIIVYPDGTGGAVPERRSQFIIAIAHLLPLLSPSHDLGPEPSALRRDINQKLAQNPKALDALLTLINEFMAELVNLNISVIGVKERLTELRKTITPFPDVPENHWAYQAVEALRRAGVVVGYCVPESAKNKERETL